MHPVYASQQQVDEVARLHAHTERAAQVLGDIAETRPPRAIWVGLLACLATNFGLAIALVWRRRPGGDGVAVAAVAVGALGLAFVFLLLRADGRARAFRSASRDQFARERTSLRSAGSGSVANRRSAAGRPPPPPPPEADAAAAEEGSAWAEVDPFLFPPPPPGADADANPAPRSVSPRRGPDGTPSPAAERKLLRPRPPPACFSPSRTVDFQVSTDADPPPGADLDDPDSELEAISHRRHPSVDDAGPLPGLDCGCMTAAQPGGGRPSPPPTTLGADAANGFAYEADPAGDPADSRAVSVSYDNYVAPYRH